jgi:hypothetical protein
MATPNEKLAASLTALQTLQKGGRRVFKSDELSRVNRERLLQNGFILRGGKGMADILNPERPHWRYHAMVRIFLGVLCAVLSGAIR